MTNAKELKSAQVALYPGPSGTRFQRVTPLLEQGIADGALHGGVLIASKRGELLAEVAQGDKYPKRAEQLGAHDAMHNEVHKEIVFDIGELTGAVCTTSLLLRLVSAGKVGVADRASRYLQALGVGQKSQITVAHLLAHSTGFPAGGSVYEDLVRANAGERLGILTSSGAKQYAYAYFHNLPLKYAPGARQVVSDANMIVLGEICELITGLSLEKAFSRFVAGPLGLRSTSFIDLVLMRRRNLSPAVEIFAPMGECPQRGRMIVGEPWDRNAWAMGGIAGHSGCFSTAHDLHNWALELLKGYRGESTIFSQDALKSFWYPELPGIKMGWRLGFESASREGGFVDIKQAPMALVATSSTGSSVFIDPLSEVVVVFLSNAAFAGHLPRRFLALRADIHQSVLESA